MTIDLSGTTDAEEAQDNAFALGFVDYPPETILAILQTYLRENKMRLAIMGDKLTHFPEIRPFTVFDTDWLKIVPDMDAD